MVFSSQVWCLTAPFTFIAWKKNLLKKENLVLGWGEGAQMATSFNLG